MTAAQFWGATPREYQAFREWWEKSRDFQQSLYAGIMATLRNGLNGIRLKAPMGGHWTPEMFMPGYVPPVETPEQHAFLAQLRHAAARQMTDEERQSMHDRHRESQERAARAREAKANGATRQHCIDIMEGKA